MNLSEKVNFWIENAEYDIDTAKSMLEAKRYVYTLFACQQAIEKILKAMYLYKNGKEAPRSHNLVYLVSLVDISLEDADIDTLAELSSFYIEGRYPDYKKKINEMVNQEKAITVMKKSEELFQCIKSRITLCL